MLALYVPYKKIWIKESDQSTQLGAISNRSSARFFKEIEGVRTKLESRAHRLDHMTRSEEI
jgi:hypothetical protein